MTELSIAGTRVGPGHPTFIVAELSGNHGGSIEIAKRIIDAAHDAGCSAVKLQTYTADSMTLPLATGPFVVGAGTPWTGRTLHDLYREAATPLLWHAELFDYARARGLVVFSTPFDADAVALLEGLDAPCYKIASFEIVDHALIRAVARTRKPLILSTGMATEDEVAEAVAAARDAGAQEIALLKCTSAYPAPPESMNLRTIPALAARFGVCAGLSDHTLSETVPVAAVALGASIIEKHVTLSRAAPGPDSSFSLEPEELSALVRAVRTTERALGVVHFGPTDADRGNLAFRRSLFAVADIAAGEALSERNVRAIRPGDGLAPKHLPALLGRRARTAISRGTPLAWSLLEGDVTPR
jgi:pseudaminic acid synthase